MILKVKPLTGKEYNIEIETTDTIETIKQKINEQEGIPIDQQRLTFRGKPLKDSKTIDSYQLKNGDERMIDVEPSDKILALKEKLEEKEGIPPQQQRLVFQGKQLKDDKTISSYKLKAGTVLHLVVALRGGEDNNLNYSGDFL
ncbi:hypothetical protein GWI33_021361 [Rhynchophorus ferrugineus]|uniref:Ubiquitin-like domain-containing protein n=1 Tax=Rhynchophorus ferrugineus TaxID=354439 RepID=A0A834LZN6_RHYFE|nr:hypothetical protein GWI33_021361 [Rhynchophorus ferrugineus]